MPDMASTQGLRVSGDPRRPQEVYNYVSPPKPDEPPADLRLVTAMMCGLCAMLLKISWFGWAGIFVLLQYTATFHWRDFDLKTTMSSVFFTVSGLVASYINPQAGGSAIVQSVKRLFGNSR